MDWTNCDWVKEDQLYYPKLRVDNKISWQHPHIIGTFRSVKLKRDVEFHSLGERLFYYFLELDTEVIRYYVQPVEVAMPQLDPEGQKKEWKHVPDVLVFRQGYIPQLYQIKELSSDQTKTFERCNKRCMEYSEERRWRYSVIYPKTLPDVIQSNINLLHGFLKHRKTYSQWKGQILHRLNYLEESTIIELARSFSSSVDFRVVLPAIYHLIASGSLTYNISKPLSENQLVKVGNLMCQLNTHFQEGDGSENEAS
ncbi:TnsA endonuclease C-terminal domain-containing protein [Paenibacillus radicis (ex Xue et al. 2023)]|uniref:TnsA endonuclease C-terminal domain-containing protein n=1 Tax=Paenibacillus radicis (ex Xue et al. 2023) TaxID=2972489 RepID=A0ABT1YJ38_9BACL|nr:TnsA endonuclease C-terminal domain-containing protein [Paenibacillus radicis (ex Xue et al. 2023)]MCR8633206.1 TnsA endonuclease C-terminal domain-containing protein [Paenibacillus radicis (ex Xue et al. 2023)]